MKKIFSTVLIILLLVIFKTSYCQNKCSAVIDWRYVGIINVYDSPDGKIIYQVKNDSVNEDLLFLEISDQRDNYFYVSIYLNSEKDKKKTGWIKKAYYIGAYAKGEKKLMDIILYKEKEKSDINKTLINSWSPELITINKYAGKWTYVSLKQKGQIYKGWIETDKLCANSYTYCN